MREILRRIGVALFSGAVVVVMLIGDLLHFASWLVRLMVPTGIDEFLRRRSNFFAFAVLSLDAGVWTLIKLYEFYHFAQGNYLLGVALLIFSKIFFLVTLNYLCHIYADRLLAVGWIKCVYEWYLGWREYIRSLAWYKATSRLIRRIKEKFKALRGNRPTS